MIISAYYISITSCETLIETLSKTVWKTNYRNSNVWIL